MSSPVVVGRDAARGTPIEVTIDGETISRIRDLPESAAPVNQWVLPGLVDIQVNGFAGTDFNARGIDVDGVAHVVRSLYVVGVTRFCPTICTQSHERMIHSLRVVAEAGRTHRWVDRALVGVHVEGPYLSPEDGPRGAHPKEHVRPPDWDEFQRFQEAAGGRIRILTLAPHWPNCAEFIRKVAAAGVVVALGHTGATPDQIREAVDAGARLSTHLGNGSHAMIPRHVNYVWEQLAADDLSASIIVDGHHLPPAVVKTFIRAKGIGHTILISDAVGLAGMPPGNYDWAGSAVALSPEGRISLVGTPYLAGSALDLASALPKVMAFAGVTLVDAVTMACLNPANLLGSEAEGLTEGSRADIVQVQLAPAPPRVRVLQTVVAGETMWEAD